MTLVHSAYMEVQINKYVLSSVLSPLKLKNSAQLSKEVFVENVVFDL